MSKIVVFGNFVAGITARAPRFPEAGETVLGSSLNIYPGGKGFSQAVAAKRAGGDVVFSTKLGNDTFAELCINMMKSEGMDDRYIHRSKTAHTSTSLVTVNEVTSQNRITLTLGSCGEITREETDVLLPELDGAGYLLLQLGVNVDATERMAREGAARGVKVVLNPAPAVPFDHSIYPLLHCITPNETETQMLTGIYPRTLEDCEKAAAVFFEKGVKTVVLTLGKQGVYANDGKRYELIPNYDVPVVDTVGAGDCFNGALVCALAEGKNLFEAARFANAASNIIVSRIGTTPMLPYRDEILHLMETGKLKQ